MAATAIRIVVLCLAAAMICASLRVHRPEMAMAVSLAVGVAALLLMSEALAPVVEGLQRFLELAALGEESGEIILRAAGIAIISEMGVQICSDAGETALAGRIRLATRIVMLGMAMPLVAQIADAVSSVLG